MLIIPENGRFAAPIVTHATVRSSKPVIVKHNQVISSLRASRTAEIDTEEATSSWYEYSPSKSRSQSHQTELYTSSSPGLSIEMNHSLRKKIHSVADLRLAFERAAQLNLAVSKQGSIPTTPKRRSIATSSESPTKIDTSTAQYPQSCPKPKQQSLSGVSKAAVTPTQPSSLRSSVSVTQLPEQVGSKSGCPLLMARTLSVKISTVKPNLPNSPTKKNIRDRLSQSGIGRKVLPGPPPSPFLQHWRTRRETAPVKSGPSVPIMVSTTVAVTTKRGSSSVDSPIPSASFSGSDDGRRKSIASSAYSKGYQDGPVESPRKDKGDSPVKDKINIFEHLSSVDNKSATSKARSQNQSASSSSKNTRSDQRAVKRPSAWELKRGAKALQALSFTGRRESQVIRTAVPLPKQPEKAAKFPVRVRHSAANPRKGTDGAAVDNNQRALGSKAMGVAPRANRYSLAPRPESTFFVKGTMWKIPHTDPNPERPLNSPKTSRDSISVPKPPSSAELVNKTADTRPNLFYSTSTKTGRILPDRKSYGALEAKQSWDAHPITHVALVDPFLDSSTQNTDLYLQSPCVGIPSISFEPPTPVPNTNTTSASSNSPALSLPIFQPPPKSQKRPRYPIIHASFGTKSGESAKKSVALGPVLSPDLAHGHRSDSGDSNRRASQTTQSWGKRAAAAAMGITRRLRERRASSSTTNSRLGKGSASRSRSLSNRSLRRRDGGTGGAGVSASAINLGTTTADVAVVATPNCRLQHPRPSRKVDWRKFEV
ncbi:hypothetical protein QBC44DRAFT_228518 [Cladorrhinum sp. PSN332]|nr:hypothetical protein QBC44DRAFT_228518 [Cladorrhinum sp. PSN332]